VVLHVETGELTPAPDSVQPSAPGPAIAGVSARVPEASGPGDTGPLMGQPRDTAGEMASQLAAQQADITAAMSAGMTAENDRRDRHQADIGHHGSSYGDPLTGMPDMFPPFEDPYFPETNP
jgi:hypothetical protein